MVQDQAKHSIATTPLLPHSHPREAWNSCAHSPNEQTETPRGQDSPRSNLPQVPLFGSSPARLGTKTVPTAQHPYNPPHPLAHVHTHTYPYSHSTNTLSPTYRSAMGGWLGTHGEERLGNTAQNKTNKTPSI